MPHLATYCILAELEQLCNVRVFIRSPQLEGHAIEDFPRAADFLKVPGPDGISTDILATSLANLVPYLTYLCNCFLCQGYRPSATKRSITVALQRSGQGDYPVVQDLKHITPFSDAGQALEPVIATTICNATELHILLSHDSMSGWKWTPTQVEARSVEKKTHAPCLEGQTHTFLMPDIRQSYDYVPRSRLVRMLRKDPVRDSTSERLASLFGSGCTIDRWPDFPSTYFESDTGISEDLNIC